MEKVLICKFPKKLYTIRIWYNIFDAVWMRTSRNLEHISEEYYTVSGYANCICNVIWLSCGGNCTSSCISYWKEFFNIVNKRFKGAVVSFHQKNWKFFFSWLQFIRHKNSTLVLQLHEKMNRNYQILKTLLVPIL